MFLKSLKSPVAWDKWRHFPKKNFTHLKVPAISRIGKGKGGEGGGGLQGAYTDWCIKVYIAILCPNGKDIDFTSEQEDFCYALNMIQH